MNSVIPCKRGAECNWPACPLSCPERPGKEEEEPPSPPKHRRRLRARLLQAFWPDFVSRA